MVARRRNSYLLVFLVYTIWASAFLSKTTFEIDGSRYYSLFDDAMISMRYAWNFVQGHGLLWNPGHAPVEGYTNFLWVMVMASQIALWGRFDSILAVQLIGLILLYANAFLAVSLFRLIRSKLQWRENLLSECLLLAFMLFYYPSNYWGLLGMETSLVTFWALIALKLVLQESYPSTLFPRLGIILGLSFLTRPDTVPLSALLFIYHIQKAGLKHWKNWMPDFVVLALIISALSLFRLAYYGSVVPNTYILKVDGVPLDARIADGVRFVTPYILTHLVLLIPSVWCVAYLQRIAAQGAKELLLLGSIVLIYVFYQVWTGGDPWPYWRMFVPVIPMLLMLFFTSLELFLNYLSRPGARTVASLALFSLGLTSTLQPFIAQAILLELPLHIVDHKKLVQRSLWLNDILYPNARIAVIWAGILPYYTDFYAIDMLGKNDPVIARLAPDLSGEISWWGLHSVPGHNKYDLDYSINVMKATYAEQVEYGSSRPEVPHMTPISLNNQRFFLDLSSPNVNLERLQDYLNRQSQ